MDEATDLGRLALEEQLPGRPLRTFPALLSTESEALSWAGQGAPDGALVVADYQVSPRGRSGLSWGDMMSDPGQGLGASVVLRPDLPEQREAWLYTSCLLAVSDALDEPTRLEWPDQVLADGTRVGAVGVQSEPESGRLRWSVVSLMIPRAAPPRTELLATVLSAIDARLHEPTDEVLDAYRQRCRTLGRRVSARMLPMGPAAPTITGVAVDVTPDGGLSIATDDGARVVVLPQSLGFLEDPDAGPKGPGSTADRTR